MTAPPHHVAIADPDAFIRLFVMQNRLPAPYAPSDSTPLRDVCPGIWPTWGDLRLLVERTPLTAIEDKIIRDEVRRLTASAALRAPHRGGRRRTLA
jgi:hypothetical protein